MSLKYRIATTIFALQVLLIGAVLWVTLGYATRSTQEQIATTEEVELQLLADLSRAALLTEEYAELQTFVERTRQDPRIVAVLITDIEGQVVVATETDLIGQSLPTLASGEHRYWRRVGIASHAGQLGTLAIEFSDRPLMLAYRDARNHGITVAGIGMVAISVVGLAMGFLLTRRLEHLAEAADRVAQGDRAVRVSLVGRDEVARVGRAFNSMVARLEENLAALRAARDRLIEPTEAMSEGFALWDSEDRLVLCNGRLRELLGPLDGDIRLGMSFEQLSRLGYERLLAREAGQDDLKAWLRDQLRRHRTPRGPRELALRDGRWLTVSEFRTSEGGTVGIYSDTTHARRRQREIEHAEARLRTIMDSVIDGIITADGDGTLESANPAAARIFRRPLGELVGLPIATLITEDASGSIAGRGSPADLRILPRQTLLEMVGHRADGSTFPLEVSIADIDRHQPHSLIVTVRDITARKDAERQILYHATHDVLTGLPNRAQFDDRLKTALKRGARHGEMLAVLFLDLDRFKIINDTLGHTIGDALLVALSRRLRTSVRAEDTVARMGGDEFILILRELRAPEDAVKPAHKILESIRPPFHLRGHELHVTASIGISLYPGDGAGPDELLRCADMALYRAKERGRNRIQLYNPTLNVRVVEQMVLEKRLRQALAHGQFVLLYQPQVALASGKVVGVEALLRWRHPERGLVAPDEFVPLAEESGLIEPLGMWVLRTACCQAAEWHQARLPPIRLAVNMSARQFQGSGLEARIRDVLSETALDPRSLELELTESVLMQEGDGTSRMLVGLDDLGVSLALDDFGTGYSSLSYLKRFPIRRVKIDRSFVRDIATSDSDAALARAVIAMAHGLGVEVVAEGIENLEQLAILRRYGCDDGQGFLLGRPVMPAQIPELLRREVRPTASRPVAVPVG